MNSNIYCEDENQEVTANTCKLVWSFCTADASACRYALYIPIFRMGRLKPQLRLLCCPGCVASLRLENALSTID